MYPDWAALQVTYFMLAISYLFPLQIVQQKQFIKLLTVNYVVSLHLKAYYGPRVAIQPYYNSAVASGHAPPHYMWSPQVYLKALRKFDGQLFVSVLHIEVPRNEFCKLGMGLICLFIDPSSLWCHLTEHRMLQFTLREEFMHILQFLW